MSVPSRLKTRGVWASKRAGRPPDRVASLRAWPLRFPWITALLHSRGMAGEPQASEDVLERLSDLFVDRGVPEHIRSDSRESSPRSVSVNGWGELA